MRAKLAEMMSSGEHRWASFDGLRAVLVMGVMAHHVEWTLGDTTPMFEAGWLPVDGFFVLSGFLITNALLREYESRGSINIAGFLARRIARLYPALLTVLAAIGVVAVLADHHPFADVSPSLGSAMSFWHNYNYGHVSPLLTEVGPFWSLSIELQFYLVFPFVAAALLALRAPRRAWLGLVLTVIVVSATWRAFVGVKGFPDTHLRVDSLMWGTLVALAYQWGLLRRIPSTVVRAGGIVSVAALAWIYLTMGGFDADTFDWGIALAAVASAALVTFLLLSPRSSLDTVLSWRPLVELGRRSYSAYLWHQTVFLFMMRHTNTGPWSRPVVGFAVTFVLADLTYRFVEQPALAWSRRWSAANRAAIA